MINFSCIQYVNIRPLLRMVLKFIEFVYDWHMLVTIAITFNLPKKVLEVPFLWHVSDSIPGDKSLLICTKQRRRYGKRIYIPLSFFFIHYILIFFHELLSVTKFMYLTQGVLYDLHEIRKYALLCVIILLWSATSIIIIFCVTLLY